MPRISTTFPLPPSFLNSHVAPSAPYATWSFVTFHAPGAVTRWSTETTLIPRAAACWITELRAVELDGLMMIAFAPAEIRLRMSALCSAAPPFLFATITLLTTPLAFAWALTAQIISSRQPLPTSVLETPITYVASPLPLFADAVTATVTATAVSARTTSVQRRPMGRNFMHSPPRSGWFRPGGLPLKPKGRASFLLTATVGGRELDLVVRRAVREPLNELARREQLVGDHLRGTDHAGAVTERRALDDEVARRERQRPPVDALPDRREQEVARPGDGAADDDEGRVEEVDDPGEGGSDATSRGRQQLDARRVPVRRRARDVRRTDRPVLGSKRGEKRAAPVARQRLAVAAERGAARKRLEAPDVAAAADDRHVVEHLDVADVACAPLSAAVELAADDDPGADPRSDLHEHDVVVAAGDAGTKLAERHQVDVVVDPHGDAVGGEARAHVVPIPARHDRWGDRAAGLELDRPRNADSDSPQRAREVAALAYEAGEQLVHAPERLRRARGDVGRLGAVGEDRPREVGDADVDARRAEIGDEEVPGVGPELDGARRPASRRRAESALNDEAVVDELRDALSDHRAAEAGRCDELRPGRRAAGADVVEDAHETRDPLLRGHGRVLPHEPSVSAWFGGACVIPVERHFSLEHTHIRVISPNSRVFFQSLLALRQKSRYRPRPWPGVRPPIHPRRPSTSHQASAARRG